MIDLIFLITFILVWNLYSYTKFVGLILSVITFFMVIFMPFVNNYKSIGFMIKMNLIVFSSICIMIGLLYKCTQDSINKILTWTIRFNIGVLLFSTNNYLIKLLLLFSATTTPYLYITDEPNDQNDQNDPNKANKKNDNESIIVLKSSLINKDLWVVLTGLILILYYAKSKSFNTNNSFCIVLLAIIIPTIFHFINNKYFESRLILLCLVIIFDVFNHNKNIIKILLKYQK
jgi:hypothetical protein